MYDPCHEQKPLLCEESDEEFSHPNRSSRLKDRVRYKIKGAAAIISRWPDHWFSSALYWWAAIGILFLLVMIAYYSFLVVFFVPSAFSKPALDELIETKEFETIDTNPKVLMHIFANTNETVVLGNISTVVAKLSNKYKNLRFLFIVVVNDTSSNLRDPQQMNKDALTQVMTNKLTTFSLRPLNVDYVSLTDFLNSSPIKNIWQHVPHSFIPFLVRVISVWDKGGIAFNPYVLLPDKIDHNYYYENIRNILKHYKITSPNEKSADETAIVNQKSIPNNIQDIINRLETSDGLVDNSHDNLTEAENHISSNLYNNDLTNNESAISNASNMEINSFIPSPEYFRENDTNSVNQTAHVGMFSKLLNYLNDNVRNFGKEKREIHLKERFLSKRDLLKRHLLNSSSLSYKNKIYPEPYRLSNKLNKLTVDLKGEIVASESPCHAFLGSLFNSVRHVEQSMQLNDFLAAELTKFCHGNIKLCKSVDINVI